MAGTASSSRIIADRYVSAIFDIAADKDASLKAFDAFFTDLESALQESAELSAVIADPTISRKEKGAALNAVAEAMKAGQEAQRFLALLAENNRLDALPQIITVFRERLSAHRGEVVLEITSARKIDAATLKSIRESLEKETGKTTVLKTHEDPSLLGGVIIKFGSTLLDSSVAGRLKQLELSLKQHIANA